MKHTYELSILGISLCPLTEETSEKYRLLRNRPDIGKWFTFREQITKIQQKIWFENYLNNHKEVMFAIFDKYGDFIGANSIYKIEEKHAEYGRLIIDPAYAGNEYGYKATYVAAIIARDQLKLGKLNLEVYSNNIPAIKTYQKVGFIETGILLDTEKQEMKTMSLELENIKS